MKKTNLTNIETRFINQLKKGKRLSKCGNKFYVSDAVVITKEIKISIRAFQKLIENNFIKMAGGGRIELVNQN